MRSWWLIAVLHVIIHVSLLPRVSSQLFGNTPRVPFICKIRKVNCAVRPESVCCVSDVSEKIDEIIEDDQEEEDLVFGDEQDPSNDGDNLIKIASNIHEVVVKPNGEPIQDTNETSGDSEITEELTDSQESSLTQVLEVSSSTTTTTTAPTPATEKIPSFCSKLKFNCKLFSSHKCCRYKLPVSSSISGDSADSAVLSSASLVKVTKDKLKKKPVVVGIKQIKEESDQDKEESEPIIPEAPKKEWKKSFFSKKYGKSKYSFTKRKQSKYQDDKSKDVDSTNESEQDEVKAAEEKEEESVVQGAPSKVDIFRSSRPRISLGLSKSLLSTPRKPRKSGICRIINCSRTKDHFCCQEEEKKTTTTSTTTTPTTTPSTTSTTTTSEPETTTLEEEDVTEIAVDDTTMMSFEGYTQMDEEDNTEAVTEADVDDATEEVPEEEEVTMVSASKSESYEETRIWYNDGIDEQGQPMTSHVGQDGEHIVHVYPVYRPEPEMRPAPVYIPPDKESFNEIFNDISNSIDDGHRDEDTDIINEVTCEHVDCLAWPSNKCCNPHVAKKRHSIESDINDRITATIIRIVKSVRWV